MTTFLIIAVAGTVLAAIVLVWPLVTGAANALGRADADAALYRDQLEELDRDIARGTITEGEAEGARAEIGRRLIAATRDRAGAEAMAPAPSGLSRIAAIGALVAAPALAAVLYLQVGEPGREDCPLEECAAKRAAAERANMPSQAEAEKLAAPSRPEPPALDPEYAQLLERLEKIVETRPMDIQGHRLLASNLARSGRWVKARAAYDKLIAILGDNATGEDLAGHAEAMIGAAGGGYVSPEAIAALEGALRKDPANTSARYYAAFAMRQGGRLGEAVQLWQTLLTEDRAAAEPRGLEWQRGLVNLITETRAALDPTSGPGPTAEDMRAAEDLTPEERQQMIAGMVARLEERLSSAGGEPEEWVRLINAYVQLGKDQDARRIFKLSQEKIGEATARSFVREQALLMGLKLE